jgi:ketosteroid isomerase-like protein
MATLFLVLITARTSEAAIQSLFDRLMAADNREDVDAVVECYAEDAVLLPPGGAAVQGFENIRPRYEALFASSRLEVRMDVESIEVKGELGFSRVSPGDGLFPRTARLPVQSTTAT